MWLSGSTRTFLVCAALLSAPPGPAAAREPSCAPWPTEPDPLPTVASSEPGEAEWATRRARELEEEARFLETSSYADARLMWQHVLCIDPESSAARAGLERTGPADVAAQPPSPGTADAEAAPAPGAAEAAPSPATTEPPWASAPPWSEPAPEQEPAAGTAASTPDATTDAARPEEPPPAASDPPPAVSAPPPAAEATPATGTGDAQAAAEAPAASPGPEGVDGDLEDIEQLVHQAHFREALSIAASTSEVLASAEPDAVVRDRRARLAILMATAQIALGQTDDARASLASAVRARPDLELDRQTTSPKVIQLLDDVRAEPEPSPWDATATGTSQP